MHSLSRLSVTDLKLSELSEKMHSGSNLKSHKTKTKAEVKNPAQSNLDIVPYYNKHRASVPSAKPQAIDPGGRLDRDVPI